MKVRDLIKKTDMSLTMIIVLASIGVPRVFVHDLRVFSLDSPVYRIVSVAPLLIWLGVALFRRSKRPFYDFLAVGVVFGVLLAVAHQISWDTSWAGNAPHVGGNLAGKLDSVTESLLLRGAAFFSSIMTGIVFGTVFGLIAVFADSMRQPAKKR